MPVEAVEACSFGLWHTFSPTTTPSGRRDLLLRPMIVGDEFNLSNIWRQLTFLTRVGQRRSVLDNETKRQSVAVRRTGMMIITTVVKFIPQHAVAKVSTRHPYHI